MATREPVQLTFYGISKCGYYDWGNATPKFGLATEAFSDLHAWVQSRQNLGDTCTYDASASTAFMRTFCFGLEFRSRSGNYLLTTWNETPANNSQVGSVDPTSTVGEATIQLSRIPKNAIPGYQTYFWLLPARNLIATLTFQNELNGQQAFVAYIKGFLQVHSPCAKKAHGNSGDAEIHGYATNGDPPADLRPDFETSRIQRPGPIEQLKSRRGEIRKIIRNTKLTLVGSAAEKTVTRYLLQTIGLVQESDKLQHIRVKYEVNVTPKQNELVEIIRTWQERDDSDAEVGFQFAGDPSIHWLGHALARKKMKLDISRSNEILDTVAILDQLDGQADNLIQELTQ